jgi:hypothetical protein
MATNGAFGQSGERVDPVAAAFCCSFRRLVMTMFLWNPQSHTSVSYPNGGRPVEASSIARRQSRYARVLRPQRSRAPRLPYCDSDHNCFPQSDVVSISRQAPLVYGNRSTCAKAPLDCSTPDRQRRSGICTRRLTGSVGLCRRWARRNGQRACFGSGPFRPSRSLARLGEAASAYVRYRAFRSSYRRLVMPDFFFSPQPNRPNSQCGSGE